MVPCQRALRTYVLMHQRALLADMLMCQAVVPADVLTCRRTSFNATIFTFAAIVAEVLHTVDEVS